MDLHLLLTVQQICGRTVDIISEVTVSGVCLRDNAANMEEKGKGSKVTNVLPAGRNSHQKNVGDDVITLHPREAFT